MKNFAKVVAIFVILFFSFTSVLYAGEKTLTLSFEKAVLESDLAGFTMQYSSVGGEGTSDIDWAPFPDLAGSVVPYVPGQHNYSVDSVFISPDGQAVQYWLRVRAFDLSANPSVWCYGDEEDNPATVTIDFEAPGGLFNMKVVVQPS